MRDFWLFVYCFKKGKMTKWGAVIAAIPVVLRNLAEQLQLHGFPDYTAMIVSLVGTALVVAGVLRKAAGWFVPPDTPCL